MPLGWALLRDLQRPSLYIKKGEKKEKERSPGNAAALISRAESYGNCPPDDSRACSDLRSRGDSSALQATPPRRSLQALLPSLRFFFRQRLSMMIVGATVTSDAQCCGCFPLRRKGHPLPLSSLLVSLCAGSEGMRGHLSRPLRESMSSDDLFLAFFRPVDCCKTSPKLI